MLSQQIQLGQQTEYAKEIRKHEANYTQYGPPGRPYQFYAYPTMMYKPVRDTKVDGGVRYDGQEATTAVERESLESIGFIYGGKAAALEALEQREFEIAELAANELAQRRTMSARANEEAERIDDGTIQHLAAIPETPIRRGPGRPTNAEVRARGLEQQK